ncbi:ABC transporter ATP-binding protein [Variovorax saccharolyticus]|uniref:ABC transporter ATP-binding protein n=1 Tax=Variovorax saccharolyticus TaxID=3053516 RepID=UPI002575295D|nr:ABC transporter ATP-binding protein [Variovorax sp. J22R187]MDM0018856.1 ABC transporter ATP-binding protein [Variovorax sp. J22R187]
MSPPSDRRVQLRGLTRRFGDAQPVLRDLSLDIEPGQFVALLGRSGSGKSTLLRILAGLDGGQEAQRLQVPASVAVAFQEPRLFPWLRVWRNVVLNVDGGDPRERGIAALQEVGLADKAQAWPQTLSGGQAQRVSLARALAREPALLLLDEPFGALDALTRLTMHRLVLDLWQRHRPTVLLVTHDVDEALLLADRVLVLDKGHIVSDLVLHASRPRKMSDPVLEANKTDLLHLLGVEVEA